MSPNLPRSRRARLWLLHGLLVTVLALPAAGQTIPRDPAAAIEEPASVPKPFTVAQLTQELEDRFFEIEPGQGSLQSSDGLTSDLLPVANRSGILETLGPPDAVRSFAYSYNPEHVGERVQNRHVAAMVLRNALPGWKDSRKWVGRAFIQAEKTPGLKEISETVDDYWIAVSNPRGRVILTLHPLATIDTDVDSLSLGLDRLLAGLAHAFPERREGMGTLFNGPGSISDLYYSDNVHAVLETLGAADDLIGLRYLYELRDDDHAQATRDNRGYAFTLVRNVFSDWAEAEDWLRAAIEQSEGEADRMAEAATVDRDGIRLQVRYFVGATASVEIKIFPRNTQI